MTHGTETWLLVLAAACGSPARAPQPPPAAAAPLPCGVPIGDPDRDVRITSPADAELQCEQGRVHCTAHLRVTIRNCRPENIVAGGHPMYLDMDHPFVRTDADTATHALAPGESWTIGATIGGEGVATVRTRIEATTYPLSVVEPNGRSHIDRTRPGGMIYDAESAPIHVTNPARDLDIARCAMCNGDWGHHAMVVTIDPSPGADPGDSCRCRTKDKDRRCEDGDDCEGWCEFERFVVTGTRSGVEVGYPVGRCSEFTEMRSCVSPIPSGARKHRPAPLERSEMCID